MIAENIKMNGNLYKFYLLSRKKCYMIYYRIKMAVLYTIYNT